VSIPVRLASARNTVAPNSCGMDARQRTLARLADARGALHASTISASTIFIPSNFVSRHVGAIEPLQDSDCHYSSSLYALEATS
jgi:hypothetical protein